MSNGLNLPLITPLSHYVRSVTVILAHPTQEEAEESRGKGTLIWNHIAVPRKETVTPSVDCVSVLTQSAVGAELHR